MLYHKRHVARNIFPRDVVIFDLGQTPFTLSFSLQTNQTHVHEAKGARRGARQVEEGEGGCSGGKCALWVLVVLLICSQALQSRQKKAYHLHTCTKTAQAPADPRAAARRRGLLQQGFVRYCGGAGVGV